MPGRFTAVINAALRKPKYRVEKTDNQPALLQRVIKTLCGWRAAGGGQNDETRWQRCCCVAVDGGRRDKSRQQRCRRTVGRRQDKGRRRRCCRVGDGQWTIRQGFSVFVARAVGGGRRSSRGWRATRQGQAKRLDNQPALLWRLIESSSGRRAVDEEM